MTASTIAHIRTLSDHGACIISDGRRIPLTVDFCAEEFAKLHRTRGVVSFNYNMELPDIPGEFMLVINRDGTVDSGSKKWVEWMLWSR